MTIDALQGTVEHRREAASGSVALADENIFPCPRCTRPLATGVTRCASCGTRLVAGVPLNKVSGFVGIGLVAGLLVGGGAVGAATLLGRPVAQPVAVSSAAAIPSVVPASLGPAPSVAPALPAVPPTALTALRQSTVVNQRLSAQADLLRDAMAADRRSAAEIAPILRTIASTAASGHRAATSVGTWADGAAVAKDLGAFYAAVDGVAQDALVASITNEAAYREAGRRMLTVLADLSDLDAASRRLAATVDVELPPPTD